MGNLNEIKRKHFRFPAYDDELGVKLVSENKRTLFQDDELAATNVSSNSVKDTTTIDPLTFQYEMTSSQKQAVTPTMTHSQEQLDELARHKTNLPNYMMSHNKPGLPKKKTNLFGSLPKKSVYDEPGFRRSSSATSKMSARDYTYDNRSYFVPKYIPASVIPDSAKPAVSEQALTEAMKKDQNSYLLFDEEPAAFQIKGNEDPTVKKFTIPKENAEIPVTRRQYQQIKPDMERFGKEDLNHSLPRSRKELKTAKEKAKSQTAYGQKVAVTEAEQEKKKGILDKPLSGIIEDSSNELENSKYFS